MKIKIQNFRGIRQAEIAVERLALVCGLDSSGKSSVAEAVATMLMRSARNSPAPGLVYEGANQARVTFERGESTVTATSLAGKTVFDGGTGAIASAVACGLESLTRMTLDQATIHVADFDMAAEVADAQIGAALTAISIDKPEQHKQIIDRIRSKGWDGALSDVINKGSTLQADWQGIASIPYVATEAGQWKPKGWWDLCDFTPDVLRSMMDTRRAALENKLFGGVTKEERSQLERDAANLEFNKRMVALRESQIKEKQDKIPTLNEETDRQTILLLEKQVRELSLEATAGNDDIAAGERAILKLAALASTSPMLEGGADDPAAAERDELKGVEDALNLANTKAKADAINAQIVLNGKLQGVLKPSGVRAGTTPQAVVKLNAKLKELGDKLGWGRVTVGDRLKVWFNDRPFSLASRVERYRATLTLQLAAALADKSAALVIEDIHILDRPFRNVLVRVLREYNLRALLTMTAASPADAPDFGKSPGVGASYWCADGTVVPLAKAPQQAKGGGMSDVSPGRLRQAAQESRALDRFDSATIFEGAAHRIEQLEREVESESQGLTGSEVAILRMLGTCFNTFARLERYHPNDEFEFALHIHGLQNLIAMRVAYRTNPEELPRK